MSWQGRVWAGLLLLAAFWTFGESTRLMAPTNGLLMLILLVLVLGRVR